MKKLIPVLSQGLLVLGGLMILVGLGWGLWERLHEPPPPTIGEAGAVVLAVTAPLQRDRSPEPGGGQEQTPGPELTGSPSLSTVTVEPTEVPRIEGPTPELLPDWLVPPTPTEAGPVTTEPTPTAPTPTPTPIPTPTPLPLAVEPPTRIVAPAIDLDARVVPMGWDMVTRRGTLVSEWVVPKNAAGWHMNSALPGHGGNVVLSGHHNIEGKVFRYVVDLNPGDEITLYDGTTPYFYTVTEKYVLKEAGMPLAVRQKNAQWIAPTDDERLTLVTCWPYEWPGNTHRVIVVARPPAYFESALDRSR